MVVADVAILLGTGVGRIAPLTGVHRPRIRRAAGDIDEFQRISRVGSEAAEQVDELERWHKADRSVAVLVG